MSLKKVHGMLEELANTDSTNDKVDLLKKFLKNKLFYYTMKMALDGDSMFHIKKLPPYRNTLNTSTNKELFQFLKTLTTQTGATKADKERLAQLASMDKETYTVVQRIIKKDPKCGASAKLVNKAKPGTISTIPYMRCSTDKKLDNIIYPAYVQEKADGMFVNVLINMKGQIKFITRNGKTVHQLKKLKKVIRVGDPERPLVRKFGPKRGIMNNISSSSNTLGMVFTGELLVLDHRSRPLPRKTGNGILNKCLHGTCDPKDADRVALRIWDCLPIPAWNDGFCDTAYQTRLFHCRSFVNAVDDPYKVDMVMTKKVDSYFEANEFYDQIRKKGGEGAILKNFTLIWKDHTSTDQVKLKNVSICELKIVGWEYGEEDTKYEFCMGALVCETDCGKLKVNVGGGFSDEDRECDWDMAEGAIIGVIYESIIQDKRDKNLYSLFLPRYDEVREDRDVADTLEEIQNR